MNIKNTIEEHHQAMINKGFYDCPACGGTGDYASGSMGTCGKCDGSKINPNKNIGELLMLIVSELSEALEAHRKNHFTRKDIDIFDWIEKSSKYENTRIQLFEINIKDTFEDEIADVYLRLFDLCGYMEIDPVLPTTAILPKIKNIGESLFFISRRVTDTDYSDICIFSMVSDVIQMLDYLCSDQNILIQKHVTAKMAYNKTRPHKHGKEY